MIMSVSHRSFSFCDCLCLPHTMNCINVRAATTIEPPRRSTLAKYNCHHKARVEQIHRSQLALLPQRRFLSLFYLSLPPPPPFCSSLPYPLLDCRDQWSSARSTPVSLLGSPLVHLLLRVCGRNSVNFFVLLLSLLFFFVFGLWGHPLQKATAIAVYAFICATREIGFSFNSNCDLGSSWAARPTSPSRSMLLPFVLPPVSTSTFIYYFYLFSTHFL